MARTTPHIADGVLLYLDAAQERRVPVGQDGWWRWLADERSTTFRYTSGAGSFTARRERKHRSAYWYAYRRQGGVLRKAYLGRADEISLERLDAVASTLAQPPVGSVVAVDGAARTTPGRRDARQNPLLITKLAIPSTPPDTVVRPRLDEQLQRGARRKLTLISAGAGFGKTTLVSRWASTSSDRVAWISLDPADNDLTRFWSYVVAALDRVEPGIGDSAGAILSSRQPASMPSILERLLAAFASLQSDLMLVLDDYHTIVAEAVHDGIAFLLDHLPPRAHLVIMSRVDPPLPLARLRVRDQMIEIRAGDLRFMPDEAAAFFRAAVQLTIVEEELATLADRTEGWIAGLKLASLALRAGAFGTGVLARFGGSHRHIADYLADEVMRRQAEEVQSFLYETSILERLSGPLCDAVTGRSDGRQMLEWLERANMFLVPLDEERGWYRYHHFFADFLRERLRQERAVDVPSLHLRAATWYAAHELQGDSIQHLLAAEEWERAAEMLEDLARLMFLPGRERVDLGAWLGRLPERVVQARPRLLVAQAWTMVWNDDAAAAETRILRAEQGLAAGNADSRQLGSEIAVLRSSAALRKQDAPEAIALARQALEDLPQESMGLRGVAAMNLGTAHLLRSEFVAAGAALANAVEWSEGSGQLRSALIATNNLAYIHMLQGQLRRAAETYRRAIHFAPATGKKASRRAFGGEMAYVGYGEVLREWNNLAAAAEYIVQGMELARQTRNDQVALAAYIEMARLQQAQGNLQAALATVAEGVELGNTSRMAYWDASRTVAAAQARLLVANGDIDRAVAWARDRRLPLHNTRARLLDEQCEYITLAQVLLGQERLTEALDLLERLREVLEDAGYGGPVIEILALQALGHQRRNRDEAALVSLEQAVRRAEPEGYVRTFLDHGAPMLELLRALKPKSAARTYLDTLLADSEARGSAGAGGAERLVDNPRLVEPLSDREKEILLLLAAGHSNNDIAAALTVAASTVKWHVKQIYGKLGVHSRVQAVGRGREIGLLR